MSELNTSHATTALERWSLLGATVGAVTAVAGIAGAISYGHMHDWALTNGEPSWRALLFPLSVDGLLVAASVVLLADSRAGRRGDWLAYVLACLGAAVSIAANVAHDWRDPVAEIAIAGWPPLALIGAYELLMRLLRRLCTATAPAEEPAPVREEGTSAAAHPVEIPDTEPDRAPAPATPRRSVRRPVRKPSVRTPKGDVVRDLADQMRTDPEWRPDYPTLMARTGFGRSWCEKRVAEAREAVRAAVSAEVRPHLTAVGESVAG